MSERIGVAIGIASCTVGGMAAAVTRFLAAELDPIALAALRFGIGFVVLLPLALRERWPRGRDWIGVALLGLLFFGIFFVLFNLALSFTTAARGALALSSLPLVTMAVAALLGVEALSRRKTVGVLIAIAGVATALEAGLVEAPAGAWRGELIMVAATLCMAFYSVRSRPFVARSSALGFLAAGMDVGAAAMAAVAAVQGSFAPLLGLGREQWLAVAYLGVGGGALAFYLWIRALQQASPVRVAATMTVNPVAAALLAAVLMSEPVNLHLVIGIAAVLAGLWIASSPRARPAVR